MLDVLDVPEVMRCVLMLEVVEGGLCCGSLYRRHPFLAHGPNLHQHPPSQAAAPTTTTVSIQDDATTTIYELTGHRQNGWVVRRGRSKRSPTERKPRTVAI